MSTGSVVLRLSLFSAGGSGKVMHLITESACQDEEICALTALGLPLTLALREDRFWRPCLYSSKACDIEVLKIRVRAHVEDRVGSARVPHPGPGSQGLGPGAEVGFNRRIERSVRLGSFRAGNLREAKFSRRLVGGSESELELVRLSWHFGGEVCVEFVRVKFPSDHRRSQINTSRLFVIYKKNWFTNLSS